MAEHGPSESTLIRTLVGGPFDGNRMRFYADQQYIVVPAGPEGPDYRYDVGPDGRARYSPSSAESSSPDREGEDRA